MNNEKTGGPVYPQQVEVTRDGGTTRYHSKPIQEQGMTLLDHFAGLAIGDVIRDLSTSTSYTGNDNTLCDPAYTEVATRCYRIAAAMIAERNRIATS